MKTKGCKLMTIACRNPEGVIECDPVPERELREGNWFAVCSRCKASYVVGRAVCETCGGSGMNETLDTGGVSPPESRPLRYSSSKNG